MALIMPRTVNPIKKRKLKRIIKAGEVQITKAMEKAGYTRATAKRGYANKSAQIIQAEIEEEFKLSMITPEFVLKRLNEDREIARKAGDNSVVLQADVMLGKYLAMFVDRRIDEVTTKEGYSNMYKAMLERRRLNEPEADDN